MNRERAMKVADAVLYEGYMLYPYRRSAMKNRQRWSFGILYPPAFAEVRAGTERSHMHSEVLLRIKEDVSHPFASTGRKDGATTVHIQLRFLQLVERENEEEGVERSVSLALSVDQNGVPRSSHLLAGAGELAPTSQTAPPRPNDGQNGAPQVRVFPFHFPGMGNEEECGTVSITTTAVRENILKLSMDVVNTSSMSGDPHNRDAALLTSLLSAHTILSISGGEFISLLDPPDELREAVSHCRNIGNFPVLVGDEHERDMMLCSPIVLYDYPQIAPESAGDFFDGTEMDEMLTLRVMTMTDDEKNEVRSSGDHVRELLQRTEASAREQLMRTHGTIRGMRQVDEP